MKRASLTKHEDPTLLLSPISVQSNATRSSSRKKVRKTFVIDLASTAPSVIRLSSAPQNSPLPKASQDDTISRLEKRLRRYRQKAKDKDQLELNLRDTISNLNSSLNAKTVDYNRERRERKEEMSSYLRIIEEKSELIEKTVQENKNVWEELREIRSSKASSES